MLWNQVFILTQSSQSGVGKADGCSISCWRVRVCVCAYTLSWCCIVRMRVGGALLTQQSSSVSPQQWCFNSGSSTPKIGGYGRSKKNKQKTKKKQEHLACRHQPLCVHVFTCRRRVAHGSGRVRCYVCVAPAGYCIISSLFTSLDYNMDGFDRWRAFHRLSTNSQSLFIMKTLHHPAWCPFFFVLPPTPPSLQFSQADKLHLSACSVCQCGLHMY